MATLNTSKDVENEVMMKAKQDQYTLQVGQAGKERLDRLNQIYNPSSKKFLIESGLEPGMHVLEIGAGTGEMAIWLAAQVGPSGTVTIADNSDAQLAIAKQNTQTAGLTNVSFINIAVNDLAHLKQKFDLIYSRWLLMHLSHPLEAMHAMCDALHKGGILVCEDGANEGCFAYPDSPIYLRWLEAWRKRFDYYGKDYNSGLKLYTHFQDLNCSNLKVNLFQPLLTNSDQKKILLLNVYESKKAILECGYLTEDEYDRFVEELQELVEDQTVVGYLRNMQVSGKQVG